MKLENEIFDNKCKIIGNGTREYPSIFEPIHGSALKYPGKDIINLIDSIESIRMMLDHLGEAVSAKDMQSAVLKLVVNNKIRTFFLGGTRITHEAGDEVCRLRLDH